MPARSSRKQGEGGRSAAKAIVNVLVLVVVVAGLAAGGVALRGGVRKALHKPPPLSARYEGEWRVSGLRLPGDAATHPPNELLANFIDLILVAPGRHEKLGGALVSFPLSHKEPTLTTWTCDETSVTLGKPDDPEKRIVLPCRDGYLCWKEGDMELYLFKSPLPEPKADGTTGGTDKK
jgi:hypothetical protein